jgi:hypothetical protein
MAARVIYPFNVSLVYFPSLLSCRPSFVSFETLAQPTNQKMAEKFETLATVHFLFGFSSDVARLQ